MLLLCSACYLLLVAFASPVDPPGNGYHSPKWRLPKWKPTYNMKQSTIFMPCNESGYHTVAEALRYGIVDYDWSNAKQLWANTKPMNAQERLVEQAERVLAWHTDTRVWVYRNAIKALNWFTDVREKLDDPAYAGWFIRFRDYDGTNRTSYHVPPCTYGKCSAFYHDQEQTPEHPSGDGSCVDKCDCGAAPCGEYVFNHSNSSFADWFISHIISKSTILHEGITGLYLDDRLETWGVSEEDGHFIEDTGVSAKDMEAMVAAFHANMERLYDEIINHGAFAWQMFGPGPSLASQTLPQCVATLHEYCRENGIAERRALAYTWNASPDDATVNSTSYTAGFLLTRGPFAWIGYDFRGCKSTEYPRPSDWDVDYGEPLGPCAETGPKSNTFVREYTKASVEWDCTFGMGTIATKPFVRDSNVVVI